MTNKTTDFRRLSNFCGLGTEFVESSLEVSSDGWCFAGFDVAVRHHVDEFAVAQKGDRRRGRRLSREVTAGAFGGFGVLSREYRGRFVGMPGLLQGHADGGMHAASSASADGVDDHHSGAGLSLQGMVDSIACAQFLDTTIISGYIDVCSFGA